MNETDFQDFLTNHSTKKYHISHGERGFFNHICHGLIALYSMGADKARLERFVDLYQVKLEKPEDHPLQLQAPPSEDLDLILGERKCFYPLLEHYENLLNTKYSGDMGDMLRGELPKLAPGMICAAFHGIIHLGYGFYHQNNRVFCEGFATLHYRYTGIAMDEHKLVESLNDPSDLDFEQVLECVRNDEELLKFFKQTYEQSESSLDGKPLPVFSRKAGILLLLCPDEVMQHVNRIRLPDCYQKVQGGDFTAITDLCKWVIDWAIMLYSFSEKTNDFFLLHGVTSSWCFQHLLCVMCSVNDVIKLVRMFLCGVIIVYIVQGWPALSEEHVLSRKTDGENFWEEVVNEALGKDYDCHIYKLIQVCREMSASNKDEKMEKIYRAAARISLDDPLTH